MTQSALSSEALDFAPDLLAIQERVPARFPRLILLTVVGLMAALFAWAALFELDIVASAEGRLIPVSLTKVVQSAETGRVAEILVRDGSKVEVGQVLLRLDTELSDTDTSAMARDVALLSLSMRRVDAELLGRTIQIDPSDPVDLVRQVEQQFEARRLAHSDAIAQEVEALRRAKAELQTAEQLKIKITQSLPSYQQSANAYRELVREGFVGELVGAEKNREYQEKLQDLRAQQSTVAGLMIAIQQAQRRIDGLNSNYRRQLQDERLSASAQLNKSQQELSKAKLRSRLLDIKATHAGIVKDLVLTTQGAVVSSGSPIMSIVPQDESLQAEVILRNEDIGFVSVGQRAQIKVSAFPFQKYGLVEGVVELISPDSSDPKQAAQTQQPALTYRALIRMPSRTLESPDKSHHSLNAGMHVVAEVDQGRRTVLEYLLSPVQKVAKESSRER